MSTVTQLRPGTSCIEPVRYGLLSIVGPTTQRNSQRDLLYKCRCACGGTTLASKRSLRRGEKKSCGCLRRLKGVPVAPSAQPAQNDPTYVVRGEPVHLHTMAAVLGRDPDQLQDYLTAATRAGRTVEAAVMPMLR